MFDAMQQHLRQQQAERVMHVRDGPSRPPPFATPHAPTSEAADGFFTFTQEHAGKVEKPAAATPTTQARPQTAAASSTAALIETPSASSGAAAAPQPSDSVSARPNTWIAGFPGMDVFSVKTAGGSGGEKTLRHRMFPFHSIPSDNDPHRPMHRTAHGPAIDAERARYTDGLNIINEPFANPQPFYTRAPPQRTLSEFDKLLAPDLHSEPNDEPSRENSTKHRPRYPIDRERGEVLDMRTEGLMARDLAMHSPDRLANASLTARAPRNDGLAPDPQRRFRDEDYPRARTAQKHRAHVGPTYDQSRAGFHSTDAQRSARKQGPKAVPSAYYTSSVDYSAAAASHAGQIVASSAEARDAADRVAGRARPHESDSAGVRNIGYERRPGSRTIRDQTLALRRSDGVAAAMRDSDETRAADRALAADRERERTARLDLARRERDFGQNASYDIITLAGADRASGPDGHTSRQAWGGGPTGGAGLTRYPEHRASTLDNQCREVPSAARSQPDSARSHQRTASKQRNESHDMWALMSHR